MWVWRQKRAWGKDAMRQALDKRFLEYARLYQGQSGLGRFRNAPEPSPNLYVYFALRHAGYVHEWVVEGDMATIGHFAVAKELEGHGFGESLVRGFARAVHRELGVRRIRFRERRYSPAYARLFQRLGAVNTGRVVHGIPEWEWTPE